MADIFNVSPPAWLQQMTASNDQGLLGGILGELAGGSLIAATKATQPDAQRNWFQELPQSIAEAHLSILDPMWRLKVQQSQLKIAETGLALQEMQQKVALNASNLQMRAEDTKEIPRWLAEHPTAESRMGAEWPVAKTPEWNRNLDQLRLRDSQTPLAKATLDGIKELTDTITDVSKYDGLKAGELSAKVSPYVQKGQMPPAEIMREVMQAREGAETRKFGQTKELIGARGDEAERVAMIRAETAVKLQGLREGSAERQAAIKFEYDKELAKIRGTALPVGARYLNMADQEAALAEDFRLKGDTASYQAHQARADEYRALAQPRVSSTEVTTTPGGATTVTQTTGPKPTAAMSTRAQENIAKYEDATVLINQLQQKLTPQDIGAKGLVGEWVLDRTLPQFGADKFFSGARVTNRVALGALRESLLRTVSDDPRFSNVDRQVISELLPSTGVFESYEDAQARLGQVKGILADRARTYATAAKMPLPDFAKTPEDMAREYNATLKQLQDAVAQKRMTPDQAYQQAQKLYQGMTNAVERFHK